MYYERKGFIKNKQIIIQIAFPFFLLPRLETYIHVVCCAVVCCSMRLCFSFDYIDAVRICCCCDEYRDWYSRESVRQCPTWDLFVYIVVIVVVVEVVGVFKYIWFGFYSPILFRVKLRRIGSGQAGNAVPLKGFVLALSFCCHGCHTFRGGSSWFCLDRYETAKSNGGGSGKNLVAVVLWISFRNPLVIHPRSQKQNLVDNTPQPRTGRRKESASTREPNRRRKTVQRTSNQALSFPSDCISKLLRNDCEGFYFHIISIKFTTGIHRCIPHHTAHTYINSVRCWSNALEITENRKQL